jgi:hypothetical protein
MQNSGCCPFPVLPAFTSWPSGHPSLLPAFPSPTEILILLKRFHCSCDSSSSASCGNTMSLNIPTHSPDSLTSGHLEQPCWDCFIWQWLATPCCWKGSQHKKTASVFWTAALLSQPGPNWDPVYRHECSHQVTALKPYSWFALCQLDKTHPFINPSIHSLNCIQHVLFQDRHLAKQCLWHRAIWVQLLLLTQLSSVEEGWLQKRIYI